MCVYIQDVDVHAKLDSPPNNMAFAKTISKTIKTAVKEMGSDLLGFKSDKFNTHSNRSATAMSMYLSYVPVYTIMLLGRWSSDAFLRYIRTQVKEFARGISGKMLLTEDFFTIPDEQAGPDDPRTTNNPDNFATSTFGTGNISRPHRARFALHI